MKLLFALLMGLNAFGLSPEDNAREIYKRLTGVPLLSSDLRLKKMANLIEENRWQEAARLASDDDRFFNVTVRDWAATMSNRKESVFVPFNDFEALVIGIVRDHRDARELLTGNFRFEAPSQYGLTPASPNSATHYLEIEAKNLNPRRVLQIRTPQWDSIKEAAGLLTSYTWSSEHLIAGTNRRPVEFAFQEFLCAPITKWRDYGRPDFRVRRDVPRSPSEDPNTYQNECRTCHAQLDALSGAFASHDFLGGALVYGANWISPKMNQNAHVYPKGYEVTDAGWINLATENHNQSLGWRGETTGWGLRSFGVMLSQSQAFSQCMVKRVYRKICREEIASALLETFQSEFEKDYQIQSLFESVATYCVKGAT